MSPETRIALLKELENLKRIGSRNSYSGAWKAIKELGYRLPYCQR